MALWSDTAGPLQLKDWFEERLCRRLVLGEEGFGERGEPVAADLPPPVVWGDLADNQRIVVPRAEVDDRGAGLVRPLEPRLRPVAGFGYAVRMLVAPVGPEFLGELLAGAGPEGRVDAG